MLKPIKHITPINSLVSVELFEFGNSRRHATMRPEDASALKRTINNLNLMPDYQIVNFVNFLPSKRSFIISTTSNRHYHMRPIFSTGFSWIYETRRRIGMPHCCARAHATNEGMPDDQLRRAYQYAYGIFASSDAIPCQRCFLEYVNKPEVYIQRMISMNSINITAADLKDYNLITYRTLIAILSRKFSANDALGANERYLISCGELTNMKQSIIRQVAEIKSLAESMVEFTDDAAADDWSGSTGDLPVDLVTNTIARTSLNSLDVFGDAVQAIDISKSSYSNMFTAQEYIHVFRKQLQSMEFAHVLHTVNA